MAVARADHPVHGRAPERQVEAVGVDLPGDVDVLGVPGPPAGDDGDVVEPVGLAPRLEDADLDLSHLAASCTSVVHTRRRPRRSSTIPSATLGSAPGGRVWHRRGRPTGTARTGRWRGRRPSAQTSRTRRSSSTSMRAVAPHTVSWGSSKNHTGNDPSSPASTTGIGRPGHDPPLLPEHAVGQPARPGPRRRRAPPRGGWPPGRGRRREGRPPPG